MLPGSLKHLPEVQTSFFILQKKPSRQGKAYGKKLKGRQFGGQPGWEQALGFQATGYSGKATKLSPQLSKRGDLKAGWQSPGFHFKLCTEAAFHRRNSSSSCTKEHKTLLGAGAAVWRGFICSSTTAHPVLWECVTLKKKLTAHLRQQKWRNISVEQTSPGYTLPLTDKDKASLLKPLYYCLFWNWLLFTWAK